MTIGVEATLRKRIRENPGGITIQVKRARNADAAAGALRTARAEIAQLDGGWQSAPGLGPEDTNGPTYLSPVTPSPSGPVLYVDGGHTPMALLDTIPDIVVAHLLAAGVTTATVGAPAQDGPNGRWLLDPWPSSVVLRLYPPPPPLKLGPGARWAKIPEPWFAEAANWVRGGGEPALWGITGPVGFPVPPDMAERHLQSCRGAGFAVLIAGEPSGRCRAAHCTGIIHETMAFGGGGPGTTDDELLDMAGQLITVARRLAPTAAYAHIGFEGRSNALAQRYVPAGRVHPENRITMNPGAGPDTVGQLCDELALDAFPYQILSPGHVARLGGSLDALTQPAAMHVLPEDRIEVTIGELASWLPGASERDPMQATARQLLAPLLLTERDAYSLETAKIAANAEGDS